MAINGISGSPQHVPPKVVAENVAPSIAQAVGPQDILGIKTKRKPSSGVSANARLSDLKPDQLSSLGGGSALETIAQSQPGTTVGEVGPLLRNRSALDSIANLMQDRRDLKVGDFVSRDQKGRVRIDPSYKDGKTMEMLKERPDITPSQISSMRQNFTKTLKNPGLGKQATEKSFELLKKRPDLKPEDMGKLMGTLRKAAGGDDKNKAGGGAGDQAGAMAALDMFDSASKLMGKRTDLKPERVAEMAQSVGKMGSPKDRNGPQNVAEAFDSASKSLEKNALRKPEEMSKMAGTMNEHFKGGDEKTAGHRMNAFKKSSEMMGDNAQVDADSVGKMLTQANERDPKIKGSEGAKKAKRLGKVMDDVATGVKSGTVSAGDLSSHFRNQDAEKARFQKTDPKKEKAKEKAKKAEEGKGPQEGQKADKAGEAKGPQEGQKADKAGEAKGPQDGQKADKAGEAKEAGKGPKEASEPEGEKKVLASFQEEEMNAPAPGGPAGAAPKVDAETVAQLGPGQAAGTASAGVTPGTTSKSGAPDKKPGGPSKADQGAASGGGGGAATQVAAGETQIQPKGQG
jgi:hypothetical protein